MRLARFSRKLIALWPHLRPNLRRRFLAACAAGKGTQAALALPETVQMERVERRMNR
jgi:hypothetical protein